MDQPLTIGRIVTHATPDTVDSSSLRDCRLSWSVSTPRARYLNLQLVVIRELFLQAVLRTRNIDSH